MQIIYYLLNIYEAILIIRILISWIRPDPDRLIVRWIYALTEPVLEPVRRILPTSGFGFDFSPIIVFIIIDLIKRAIISSFYTSF